MKSPISIILPAMLVLISCAKASPHHDLAKMATLVKEGMTKEEVIKAIGNPDMNSQEHPELSKNPKPGFFIFSYQDGPVRNLIVSFKEDKVAKINNFIPPPEIEKTIQDAGLNR